MFQRLKNESGIALILVISSVMFLTVLVFDFWTDAQMGHQLAINYKARVQSYYLAKSGVNFSKLVIFYNKKIESMLSKNKMSMGDIGMQPLYKQVPINSEGLRGMLQAAAAANDSEDSGDSGDDNLKGLSMLSQDDVESFLGFDGNFDAEISEEQSKYSLNAVSKMTSKSSSYDLHKKVLQSILMRPMFKTFFENQDYDVPQLVHAISDFVDSNGTINEYDKVERGSESSIYRDADYPVKSSTLLTVSELRLVQGMSDDIYQALEPLVTVYHTSEKVNVCLADTEIMDAMIVHYTNYSDCTTSLDSEDDKEEIESLRSEALGACPDDDAVASALNAALGIKTTGDTNTASTAASKANSSKATGCKVQFKDLITSTNNIFRIKSEGDVSGVKTKVNVVIDTSNSKASKWKVLFYQVD